ncbi:uncharacterized protein LOC143218526 isoform X1 [Lasioglossum baleicum]|uniref:uncharacterized protein LOC143218526 isoform X1 n=1 Tax=Lasioglossum baleicum TaxID=434251 RepID=UPI003FCD27F2
MATAAIVVAVAIAVAVAPTTIAPMIAITNVANGDRGFAKKRSGDHHPGYSEVGDAYSMYIYKNFCKFSILETFKKNFIFVFVLQLHQLKKKLLKIRYGQASGVEEARQNRECEGRSQRNAYSMQIAMATAAIAVATTIAIANVATADRGVAKKRPGDKNPGYSQDRDA